MNLVACPKCGSRFDVSTLQPGSTFVCGSCKNVLQVPRQPVPGPAATPQAPVRPKAPQRGAPGRAAPGRAAPKAPTRPGLPRKPAATPRVDPRRAGGATSTNMPATGVKPARAGGGGRVARAAAGGAAGGSGGRGRQSRRAPASEKPKNSAMPLILGGVGLGVVAIVVVLVIVFTSGPGDDQTGGGGGGGQG